MPAWYRAHRRQLPWREKRDPYHIWLSEIIMQQTRVQQGLAYYERFVERFPTVHDLSAAPEQEVLKLWQGLGYYSRARNLHRTAREVAEKYGGRFPDAYKEMIALKGIGPYTAAAILSIAYGQPYAVLDGNVYRVLSRLFGLELPINASSAQKVYGELAQEVLWKENPGLWNETMMELGAMVCTPQSPLCVSCPVQSACDAYATGRVGDLPVKLKGKGVKERFFHYFVLSTPEGLWLRRRPAGDIWQGLYDFPLIETDRAEAPSPERITSLGFPTEGWEMAGKDTRLLTHQRLYLTYCKLELPAGREVNKPELTFVPYEALASYPVPKPVEIFLKRELETLGGY